MINIIRINVISLLLLFCVNFLPYSTFAFDINLDKQLESLEEKLNVLETQLTGNAITQKVSSKNRAYKNKIKYKYKFENSFGGYGSNRGSFSSLAAIDGNSQYLFVCDADNNRIVRINHHFQSLDYFTELPEELFNLDLPTGILFYDAVTLWVVDSNNHRLIQYSYDGNYQNNFGALGISSGQFDSPKGISRDIQGNIYVCDTNNDRIQVFDTQGEYIREFGKVGPEIETLLFPSDIQILKNGNALVSNTGKKEVKLYDSFGNFIKNILPNKNTKIESPAGIALDQDNNVYIVDSGSASSSANVLVLSPDSNGLVGIIATDLDKPTDVFCWGNKVFVTDENEIKVFNRFLIDE